MKRFGQLMERIATRDNLSEAFHRAAAGRRNRPEVLAFFGNLERQLNTLAAELREGGWRPGPYRRFVVRDPKLRVIHAAPFRDRVVHHALIRFAEPCFERGAVPNSCACRVGFGNREALRLAKANTRRWPAYLKLDLRKYFDSIQHDILATLLRRRFKDGRLLEVLDRILRSYSAAPGRGLPIGTLTSQYLANFFLDGLDHWILEGLKVPGYVRYMDDLVLWHDSLEQLNQWRESVARWVESERGLTLKGDSRPAWSADGIPFLGYRFKPGLLLLGRRARRRMVSRLAGYESAHLRGRMTAMELQRRCDALLAFTEVASCRQWRARALTRLPLVSLESGVGIQ